MTINPATDILFESHTMCLQSIEVLKFEVFMPKGKTMFKPCSDLCKCSDCDNVSHATDLRDDCDDGDDDGDINCNDYQEDYDEDEGYEMLM